MFRFGLKSSQSTHPNNRVLATPIFDEHNDILQERMFSEFYCGFFGESVPLISPCLEVGSGAYTCGN